VALQESEGQEGYWRTFWDKDCVFYGHVLGCKGLERKVVVLCVNERRPRERSRERLYVGLSRATDKLVVVGPPDVIREMGARQWHSDCASPDVAIHPQLPCGGLTWPPGWASAYGSPTDAVR